MISITKKVLNYPFSLYRQRKRKRILRKINAKKKERGQHEYNFQPDITFIIQFFNKQSNISEIFAALQSFDSAEIIVIDDGSVDGSFEEWMKLLVKPNHFLIRSNDLHEVITYDRALRMAKGTLACLLQDDDVPVNSSWVQQAKLLFQYYPRMIILGGKSGLEIKVPDKNIKQEGDQYIVKGNIASIPGIAKYRSFKKPTRICPNTGIPFMFCSSINRAPMFVKVSEYLQIGGTDLSFAPFQCDDVDVCLRAWKNGYQVGFYQADFRRNIGTGGMRLFNANIVSEQAFKNWKRIYQLHENFIGEQVNTAVDSANSVLQAHSDVG